MEEEKKINMWENTDKMQFDKNETKDLKHYEMPNFSNRIL